VSLRILNNYDLSDVNTSKNMQKDDNIYIHVYKLILFFRNKRVYKRLLFNRMSMVLRDNCLELICWL